MFKYFHGITSIEDAYATSLLSLCPTHLLVPSQDEQRKPSMRSGSGSDFRCKTHFDVIALCASIDSARASVCEQFIATQSREQRHQAEFRAERDEECEDDEGNVYTKKTFEDLAKRIIKPAAGLAK